jgi:drug/metabolite transporter (DMT)-like permease
MNSTRVFYSLLLALVSLTWAGSFIVVRLSYQEVSPLYLGFFRFVVATPIMVLIVFLRKKAFFLPKKELPSLIVLGLTGVTLIYIFQFYGVAFTTAGTASSLINTNVLFIAIFSAIFLKEPFPWNKKIGVLLSFTGVFFVVFGQLNNETIMVDSLFLFGCVLILCSALCWAVYTIVGKHLLETYDTIQITSHAFIIGLICYLPFVLPNLQENLQTVGTLGLIAILYLGIFCSVFAYIAWYYVLSKQQAARSAVFLTLIPLFTITLSFFIGEVPTSLFFLGAVFIMTGVYLTQRKPKEIKKG